MYRVSLDNVGARRTCRPLYEKHQATPVATFLDAAEAGVIYSGMVLMRTGADTVGLYDGTSATKLPFGLSALDKNTVINDLDGLNIKPWAVWIGGPDAMFTIDAPAFDDGATWAVPTDGTRQNVYATSLGKLTTVADGAIVAELIEVVSTSQIIIRLLSFTLVIA